MSWNIGEGEVFWADKVDRRTFIKRIVFLTHKSCIFDGFMAYVMDVLVDQK
jgi:hypothetical protein